MKELTRDGVLRIAGGDELTDRAPQGAPGDPVDSARLSGSTFGSPSPSDPRGCGRVSPAAAASRPDCSPRRLCFTAACKRKAIEKKDAPEVPEGDLLPGEGAMGLSLPSRPRPDYPPFPGGPVLGPALKRAAGGEQGSSARSQQWL